MPSASSDSTVPSVKLFPRLAVTNRSQNVNRALRLHAAARRRIAADDQRPETSQSQVRARLLRMILENERVRRHEQRPSAS